MRQDGRGRDDRRPRPADMPPSFTPEKDAPRPDARSARPVSAAAPDATRKMPAGGTRQPPGRTSQRPAAQPAERPRATAQPAGNARPAAAAAPPPAYPPHRAGPPQPEPSPADAHRPPATPPRPPRRRRRRGRRFGTVLVILLVLLLAWPVGLLIWANGKINHVTALSDAASTAGTTYLLAGSDSRADGAVGDSTEGERSDSIMLLHKPSNGPAALISLPRDTLTDIPGHGPEKLNASYALGGPELLVASVEGLTGLTVDHYVEIGMGGVRDVVDAVGGVELCLDYDVDDWRSKLEWEAGCHHADGETALAFARMRYADPDGDIGRTARQRQIISAIVSEASDPGTLVNPVEQVNLVDSGLGALRVDDKTGIIDLGRMALAFRSATGADGIIGPPPIADYDYRPGGAGSTVLLDPARAPDFFARLRDGELTPADVA